MRAGSVDEHDTLLAERWDAVIRPHDVVWVLGDLATGSGAPARNALEWIAERPGRKRLIAGNHDPIHPMHRDAARSAAAYDAVFEWVAPFARIKHCGVELLLSHFPYDGDHTEGERYRQYRLHDFGVPLLHGHTHSSAVHSVSAKGTPQIHVGVDAWNLAPVKLDRVVTR